MNNKKMRIMECFGGIGACTQALKRLGVDVEVVDYVEIDDYAVGSYNAINGTNFETQDITQWNKHFENVDLIMHGSPCQDFSLAGKQAGGDEGSGTRSSLMYETIRIVEDIKPKYVVWENVKNLLSKTHIHNFNAYLETMEQLGYKNYYQVLNAKDYGIPQNRERVFTISIRNDINKTFEFPKKQELKLKLKDMLEEEVEEKYYLSNDKISSIAHWKAYQKPFERVLGNESVSPTLTARGAGEEHSGMITYCENLESTSNLQEQCLNIKKEIESEPQIIGGAYARDFGSKGKIQDGDCVNTLTASMGTGGGNIPLVNKPRKDIKEEEKYCEYCGKQLERKRFNGRLEDFTVFKNRKYCNRECMKKDYLKIGDNHNQTYSNAHTTARKINELILHKEVCELCGSEINLDIHHIDGNWQNNNLDNLMCLCRSCHTKYERNKDKINNELRIRKLTPREVWRLMGFSDEAYEKASKVNNNAQLYKQAGNSIVVDVLEAIFKNLLFEEDTKDEDDDLLKDQIKLDEI